jgi:Tol biopolymer transport system component
MSRQLASLVPFGLLAMLVAACGGVTGPTAPQRTSSSTCDSITHCPGLFEIATNGTGRRALFGRVGAQIRAVSPSRQAVAFIEGDSLYVAEVKGQHETAIASGGLAGSSVSWSQEGTLLAFQRRTGASSRCAASQLWIATPTGRGLRKLSNCAGYPSWSPDSKQLAFIGRWGANYRSGQVTVIRVAAQHRSPRHILAEWTGGTPDLVWSPRGDRLAYVTGERTPTVIVVSSGGTRLQMLPNAVSPSWSPDGRELALIHIDQQYRSALNSGKQSLRIVDLAAGGRARRIDTGRTINLNVWSPSGDMVAYDKILSKKSGDFAEIYLAPIRGGGPRQLTHEYPSPIFEGIWWARDANHLLYVRQLSP